MTVTVTLRERGSNAFLELRSLFINSGQEQDTGELDGIGFTHTHHGCTSTYLTSPVAARDGTPKNAHTCC